MRTLALCADDYGQSAAIDRGVLRLVERGRLTEVSCLVGGAAWGDDAAALARTPVRTGLHFNLTEGVPLSDALRRAWPRLPSLPRLILRAHAGRLPLAALRAELQLQCTVFAQAMGRAPAHLDGHQHVHHLPGVRGLVLAQAAALPGLRVRDTGRVRGAGFGLKRRLIEGTGGRALHTLLQARGLQANTELRGVYDFQPGGYRGRMQRWLADLPDSGALVFCHPGQAAADPGDPIAAARVQELAYLDSEAFIDDLRGAGVRLGDARPAARA